MASDDSWEEFLKRPSWGGSCGTCLHGGPRASKMGAFPTFMMQSAMSLQTICGEGLSDSEIASRELDALFAIWSKPEASRTIKANSYKVPFSMAVDALYDRQFETARQGVRVGCFLREWARLGQDEFLRIIRSADESSADHIRDMTSALWKTRTDRGLTLFLASQVPCNCLREAAEAAAGEASMGKCQTCKVQKPKRELKRCGGCHFGQYCSRACQKADWPEHKKACLGRKGGMEPTKQSTA